MNVAIVVGRLSSAPRLTRFESGDVLVRYEVTVEREGEAADSVPVSWIGPPERAPAVDLEPGEPVVVFGRVRRRFFRSGGGPTRSSTEVVADRVAPASDRRRAGAVLAAARAAVANGP